MIEKFNEDIHTREAVISIADPVADDFDARVTKINGKAGLLVTKDTPCTRSIHFMVVNGKMNMWICVVMMLSGVFQQLMCLILL